MECGTEDIIFQIYEKLPEFTDDDSIFDPDYDWSNVSLSTTNLECHIILKILKDENYDDLLFNWIINSSTDTRLLNCDFNERMISKNIDRVLKKVPTKMTWYAFSSLLHLLEEQHIPEIFKFLHYNEDHIDSTFRWSIEYLPNFYFQLSERYSYDPFDVFLEHEKREMIKIKPEQLASCVRSNPKHAVNILDGVCQFFYKIPLEYRQLCINMIKYFSSDADIRFFITILTTRVNKIDMIENFEEEIDLLLNNEYHKDDLTDADESEFDVYEDGYLDTKTLFIDDAIAHHNTDLLDFVLMKHPEIEYFIQWRILHRFNSIFLDKYFKMGLTQDIIDEIMKEKID